MLRVKTKIMKSKINGFGLFADQFIPKGTVTWQYDPKFDPAFTKKEIDKLPEVDKDFLLKYAYFDKNLNKFVLCSDNQRYINHCSKGKFRNIKSTITTDISAKDIKKGEELLCDYRGFDPEYFKRLKIPKSKLI